MNRITTIDPDTATGHTHDLFAAIKAKLGVVPNMMRGMAQSPAALDAYLQFSGKLAGGVLPAKTREQIALAVGQQNGCEYCVAAHSALGKMAGLTPEQTKDARLGTANDPKTAAILTFSHKVVEARGLVSDADVDAVREAGATDGEIAEVVAHVALNVFTNYFNIVAGSVLDFPKAEALPAVNS